MLDSGFFRSCPAWAIGVWSSRVFVLVLDSWQLQPVYLAEVVQLRSDTINLESPWILPVRLTENLLDSRVYGSCSRNRSG